MGRKRAVQAVRELVTDGRSSTLALFDLDVTGDAAALAELAAVLLHELAAATGRDAGLLLVDVQRDLARGGSRSRA
jgi:hypothetical protein